ncbi:MAG: nicotinate (nicotinamide) nucleotide adenylyltransferase [Candidatus Margulisiibacteriota bacterium]
MHVSLFGGAFDPLHNGHVDIVDYILNVAATDQLLLVPTGHPVHKPKTFFPSDVRMAMLQSVFGDNDRIIIDPVEINVQRPSYTTDTIAYIHSKYQPKTLTLVVGFDQLYQFHRWRNYESILQECDLLVILRQGIDHDRLMKVFPRELIPYQKNIKIHEVYPTEVSSTNLRIKIKKNLSIESFVPPEVAKIIAHFQQGPK